MTTEQRMKLAGKTAFAAGVIFALPHFWFWFGVSLTFPGEFPANLPRSGILLIVGGAAVLVAVYALALTHSARWPPASIGSLKWRLPEFVVTFLAWSGGIGMTIWGLLYYGLMAQRALGLVATPSDESPYAIWGYYWYSLFIVWGLSLIAAAVCFHRVRKSLEQAPRDVSSRSIQM